MTKHGVLSYGNLRIEMLSNNEAYCSCNSLVINFS